VLSLEIAAPHAVIALEVTDHGLDSLAPLELISLL
jgi:acyl carrier protein